MIVIDKAGLHPFKGASPPFDTNFAAGDIDELIFSDKHKSVFCGVPAQNENGNVAELAVRILLDAEKLLVPRTDPGIKNLNNYFDGLPRRAVIYAMRNGRRVNYSLEDIRRDWNLIFKKNAYYRHLAKTRYQTPRQALLEFHASTERNNRFFQQLVTSLYDRITAFTEERAARTIFGAAIVHRFRSMYRQSVPLISF